VISCFTESEKWKFPEKYFWVKRLNNHKMLCNDCQEQNFDKK
jgi:hypothetical protein